MSSDRLTSLPPPTSPTSPTFCPKQGSMNFCPIDRDSSMSCNSFWSWIVIYCVTEIGLSDPSRQIAQTRILSLRWIDALWGMDLRAVSCRFCRADLHCLWEMGNFDAQNSCPVWPPRLNSLPTGLNRISWKRQLRSLLGRSYTPYRLG
jgi:hypothetical protein